MRSRLTAAAVAVLLFTSACTSEDPMPTPDPAPTSDAVPSPSVNVFEGPASRPALWPDGVSAQLVAVERVPNSWGVDVPDGQAIVRLTLEVTNASETVLPVEPASKEMNLLYGPNREEGQAVTSYTYDTPAEQKQKALDRDGGAQIPAAGSATFVESQVVPVDQLGVLTVVVEVPSADGVREPFTLTGVETLLKNVR
jgi:hypothetical protein